jgi:MerR family mercuric resistance operon transcriptional regulator
MSREMTIGKLAQATGVSVETVRYYQRVGLLTEPCKPVAGYRLYSGDQARRIQFIRRAQGLGFTLAEISELLKLETDCLCADTRELAVRKLKLIDQRMADLTAMHQEFVRLIQQCDMGSGGSACPIIDVLSSMSGSTQRII